MKKSILFVTAFLFACAANAQQTEDDIYVGKARTFGNYRGTAVGNSKPNKGITIITGTVVEMKWCEDDCMTMLVKKQDGTMVTVGTADYGFKVPKGIKGRKIIIEGVEPARQISDKRTPAKEYQQNIQFAASGLKLLD